MTSILEQTTISMALNDFLRHCRFERKLDDKTISAYQSDILQFANSLPFGEKTSIFIIRRENIKKWLGELSNFKFRTVKRKVASIRAFMRYLEVECDEFNNPLHKMQIKLKEPVRLPVVMTRSEVKLVLSRLEEDVISDNPSRQSYILAVRNHAVLELLFGTGMRIGELCLLRIHDVDLENGRVYILGKGNRERVVDICLPVTLHALKQWQEIRCSICSMEDGFFINRLGRCLAPQTVRALVHKIARECGIVKKITPHTFRHTFATLLLEENVDIAYIKSILGHSSIATTQIYLHVNPIKQREILMNHHPRSRM